jgi:predicted RNase H-like nuclease (RuvC/YqgF family)
MKKRRVDTLPTANRARVLQLDQALERKRHRVSVLRSSLQTEESELLALEAQVESARNEVNVTNAQEESIDHLLSRMCETGTLDQVRECLSKGSDVNVVDDKGGRTPLMLACVRPDWKVAESIVKLLLTRKGRQLQLKTEAPDDGGASAIHHAARYSSAAVVRILLDAGCPIDPRTSRFDCVVDCCVVDC